MRLYTYYRSSASWRIRIVLALKGVEVEQRAIHLRHGEQAAPSYTALNPQGLVPALETGDGRLLTQSQAIAEFLEETCPDPPLLPANAVARAYVRSVVAAIACDIHPLNNLRVLRYLARDLAAPEPARDAWYRHWVTVGLAAVEATVAGSGFAGAFCCGDRPTLADAFLIPQLGNARRYACPLDHCPTLTAIEARCADEPAFARARPEAQPDYEGSD